MTPSKQETNQSRICDCWLNVGLCYCTLEHAKDEEK